MHGITTNLGLDMDLHHDQSPNFLLLVEFLECK